MPKPICIQCSADDSLLWRSTDNGQICNDCHVSNTNKDDKVDPSVKVNTEDKKEEKDGDSKAGKSGGETTPAKATGKGTRKSTRATRYKTKTPASASKTPTTRGRGRRSMTKRHPLRAPVATATIVTSDSIFYKGSYMQIGDIVSVTDIRGGTFYAQVRGFMTDQYCEKSAVITWLIPTRASPSPEERFDPSSYIIGPEEDLPRKLDAMEFVMHAPSDYYKTCDNPYPLTAHELHDYSGYIWASLEQKEKT